MSGVAAETESLPEPAWELYEMIQAFLQAPLYHMVFEVVLIVCIVKLVFMKSYKPERTQLTEKEKDELIEEWQPEPLVPDVDENDPVLLNMENRLVNGLPGKMITINGQECLNMATFNFLGMIGRQEIVDDSVKSLRKYGVGSCGPRGFYGTVDVHLKLEEKLEEFMGVEEAIVYSYGFSTVASAIPAYSKRGDIIFCDEAVSFAIQQGILASRSKVKFFKHNDMTDLERVLKEQEKEDKKNPKKAKSIRRFLVVEGLYFNTGEICDLPKLVELKWKYKVRIFMDESISFGTLGDCGKGVTEHFKVDVNEIDLISASLENSLGSTGGFCCGKAYVIDHQRLSGLGYCFSASTPPMLSQAAITALKILHNSSELVDSLQANAKYMHTKLSKIPALTVGGSMISPVIHCYLAESTGERSSDVALLNDIVARAEEKKIALVQAAYLENKEHCLPKPSIRVTVNSELSKDEMDTVISVIREITDQLVH